MPLPARSTGRPSLIETLESRRMLSASAFGDAGNAVRFAQAVSAFPAATGAGQTIAVIDSGIDYMHPSLGGGFGPGYKVVGGYDFVDNDSDPMDSLGHGTEVAGVLAAKPASSSGNQFQGIAPNAKLVALRIDDGDEDTTVPDALIEQALRWTIDHRTEFGITVVNISYGQGRFADQTVSTVYGDEIAQLRDLGVVIVAAAGNSGINTSTGGINSPASDPNVISVGSLDTTGTISESSQRSANLSLFAPGEDVLTTFQGGGYGYVGGTSYAAPIVAGTVALMKNVDGNLLPADTMSILRASGVSIFDGGTADNVGTTVATRRMYPKLDMLNALSLTNSRRAASPAEQALIGQYGNGSSLAVDPQGVTHFVYFDNGKATMQYATRNTAGQWSARQNVDVSLPDQGFYLSMALDSQGQPAIAYFDGVNSDLEYAQNTGSEWAHVSLDTKNSAGAYPSLIFDRNGLPFISYYRKTSGDLRAARRDMSGTWTIEAIATDGDVGRGSTAAVNSQGSIGVAYDNSTTNFLDYAQNDPGTGKWGTINIDNTTRGVAYASLAFSPEDDRPWIAYYDAYTADLKVANFARRRWRPTVVASRGAIGLFNTLFFGTDDSPTVVYYNKRLNSLNEATFDGEWSASVLQAEGGRFATGAIDPSLNVFRYVYYKSGSLYQDLFNL